MLSLIVANSQDSSLQQEGLNQLRLNSNMTLVGDCNPVTGPTTLNCPMLSDESLEIENQIYLRGIETRIRTCNSSMWFLFTYSNESVNNGSDYLSGPTVITLGQLMISADISTCVNSTTQCTEIWISVSLCDSHSITFT